MKKIVVFLVVVFAIVASVLVLYMVPSNEIVYFSKLGLKFSSSNEFGKYQGPIRKGSDTIIFGKLLPKIVAGRIAFKYAYFILEEKPEAYYKFLQERKGITVKKSSQFGFDPLTAILVIDTTKKIDTRSINRLLYGPAERKLKNDVTVMGNEKAKRPVTFRQKVGKDELVIYGPFRVREPNIIIKKKNNFVLDKCLYERTLEWCGDLYREEIGLLRDDNNPPTYAIFDKIVAQNLMNDIFEKRIVCNDTCAQVLYVEKFNEGNTGILYGEGEGWIKDILITPVK